MGPIKAIETRYRGYRMRSRLEARWAVFFDALGLKWEYEPEGFELPDGTRYLPDFFLPGCGKRGVFAEVKPEGDPAVKAREFWVYSARPIVLLAGSPSGASVPLLTSGRTPDTPLWFHKGGLYRSPASAPGDVLYFTGVHEAVNAARGARFDGSTYGMCS